MSPVMKDAFLWPPIR